MSRMSKRTRQAWLARIIAMLVAACAVVAGALVPARATTTAPAPVIFATYYTWWSLNHWKQMLGSSYPYTASPLPLPATLDASGCNPVSSYSGNKLLDVPSKLYDQSDPGVIAADVQQAAAAGLAGFIVSWVGSGTSGQTDTSTPYSYRLKLMVDAVHALNAAGGHFHLWLSYAASASARSDSQISNDLQYFVARYAHDSAFALRSDGRETMIWQGSWKYPTSSLATAHNTFVKSLRILGDEHSWTSDRAQYLEGDAYYWSSQDPYRNPQSFQQLQTLANNVRSSPLNPDGTQKAWIAPMNPGFDSQLIGGSTCIPRVMNGERTIQRIFDGNLASAPAAWDLISWNEIAENTYIDPMTRYGDQDLQTVRSIIANGH